MRVTGGPSRQATELAQAASEGKSDELKQLAAKATYPDALDEASNPSKAEQEPAVAPPLYWAARAGNTETVQTLLDLGARASTAKLGTPSAEGGKTATQGKRQRLEGEDTGQECAARMGYGAMVEALASKQGPEEGALKAAVEAKRAQAAASLIKSGAKVTAGVISSALDLPTLKVLLDPHGHGAWCSGDGDESGGKKKGDKVKRSQASQKNREIAPFLKLRPGMEALFERALEEARRKVGSGVGVYPYDLLMHDERIVELARVAAAMEGYGKCEKSCLTESCLYAVMAYAKERVEAEMGENKCREWRTLVEDAVHEELGTSKKLLESVEGKAVWVLIIDALAERSMWGAEYESKRAIFTDRSPLRQRVSYAALGGDVERWFKPRPPPPSEAELADAERKVAALTPKGRELMQGIFPPGHFASKMSMRQLVFSVEGGACTTCGHGSCSRCRPDANSLLHHHLESGQGKSSLPTASPLLGGQSSKGKPLAELEQGKADEMVLSEAAWEVLRSQEREISAFYGRLSPQERRRILRLPAKELDKSMALSKEWDVLASAELEYDYSSSTNPIVHYDSRQDAFFPGALLVDSDKGVTALLESLDPSKSRQASALSSQPPLSSSPPDESNLAAAAEAAACINGQAVGIADFLLGSSTSRSRKSEHAETPKHHHSTRSCPLSLFSRSLLELHFTRLFAVRLLARFGEAAKEAAAQAALESLLRDEEQECQTGRQGASSASSSSNTSSANNGKAKGSSTSSSRRRRGRRGRRRHKERDASSDTRHDKAGEEQEEQEADQKEDVGDEGGEELKYQADDGDGDGGGEPLASDRYGVNGSQEAGGDGEKDEYGHPSHALERDGENVQNQDEALPEDEEQSGSGSSPCRTQRRGRRGRRKGRGKNGSSSAEQGEENDQSVANELPRSDAEEAVLVRQAIQESLKTNEAERNQKQRQEGPALVSDPASMPAMPVPSTKQQSKANSSTLSGGHQHGHRGHHQQANQPPRPAQAPAHTVPSPGAAWQAPAAAAPADPAPAPAPAPPPSSSSSAVRPPPGFGSAVAQQQAQQHQQAPGTPPKAPYAHGAYYYQDGGSPQRQGTGAFSDPLLHELTGLDLDSEPGSPSPPTRQQQPSRQGEQSSGTVQSSLFTSNISSAFGGGLFTDGLGPMTSAWNYPSWLSPAYKSQ